MSTEPVAQVKVRLNKAEAEADAADYRGTLAKTFSAESIQGLSSSVSAFGGKASSVWGTIKSAYEGAEAVLQRIVGIYNSEAVAGAIEEEQAQLRLATALRLRGEAGAELASQRAEQADALERVIGLAAAETMSLDSQLVLLGVQTERLDDARAATIGLAEVTGKDLHAAARDVAAVLRGETTRAIKQIGLDGMEAEAVMARLAGNMALAEERAASFGGRVERMNDNIDDMLEPLGEAITKSSTWSGGLDTLRLSALGVKEVLGDLADTLVDNFITGAAGDALDFLASPLRLRGFEAEAAAREQLAREERDRSRAEEERIRAQQAAGGGFVGQLNARVFGGLNFDEEPAVITGQSNESKAASREAEANARKTKAWLKEADEAIRRMDALLVEHMTTMEFAAPEGVARLIQTEAEAADRRVEIQRNMEAERAAIREASARAEASDAERRAKDLVNVENEVGRTLANAAVGVATAIASTVGAAIAGQADLADMLRSAVGSVLVMIGTMLAQIGTAGILGGTLGTVAPVFAGLTGGAMGVAAGAAALAGGIGLIALGSAMGASGGGATPSAPSIAPGGGNGRVSFGTRTEADMGPFNFGMNRGGETSGMLQINYYGGIHGGDPREMNRDLRDLQRRGQLTPTTRVRGY